MGPFNNHDMFQYTVILRRLSTFHYPSTFVLTHIYITISATSVNLIMFMSGSITFVKKVIKTIYQDIQVGLLSFKPCVPAGRYQRYGKTYRLHLQIILGTTATVSRTNKITWRDKCSQLCESEGRHQHARPKDELPRTATVSYRGARLRSIW